MLACLREIECSLMKTMSLSGWRPIDVVAFWRLYVFSTPFGSRYTSQCSMTCASLALTEDLERRQLTSERGARQPPRGSRRSQPRDQERQQSAREQAHGEEKKTQAQETQTEPLPQNDRAEASEDC